MTYLLPSAAYVRKNTFVDGQALQTMDLHPETLETVWSLLETPQTVESLQRAAARDTSVDRQYIKDVMEWLLDADLIELSPDS